MIGTLPTTLDINGVEYPIRTNFKDILKIMEAFTDPELEDSDKIYISLTIIYPDFDSIPKSDYEEAFKKGMEFINFGDTSDNNSRPKVMDWVQDEKFIFPAINKVAGFETRMKDYIHWWTFLGYYMTIDSEGMYSQILALRSKKAKGKKLESWESKYWNENKDICVLKERLSEKEIATKAKLFDAIK